jgi:hypothetical protein
MQFLLTIQKHHRQLTLSVSAPPMMGARMMPRANMLLARPMNMGRLAGVLTVSTIVKPPLATPEAPTPATARPAMNMLEVVAAPQMTLPIRKMVKKNW